MNFYLFPKRLSAMLLALSMVKIAMAQQALVQPLVELQGRVCFGYLYATNTYIDFYTQFDDCHRMAYDRSEISAEKKVFYLRHSTRMCPFAVIEVRSDKNASLVGLHMYSTEKDYKQLAYGDPSGNSCPGVELEKPESVQLLPESRRVPVVKKSTNRRTRKTDVRDKP